MKEQILKNVMDNFGMEKINNYPRIKEQVVESMEAYANQRIIEELEKQVEDYFNQDIEIYLSTRLKDRIKELKQD